MFIQVGRDAYIATAKIKQVVPYRGRLEHSTLKAAKVNAKRAEGRLIELAGRSAMPSRSLIVMQGGWMVLSALPPEEIEQEVNASEPRKPNIDAACNVHNYTPSFGND